ncbi:MAG: alpha/beta hydrolase [bacterium]
MSTPPIVLVPGFWLGAWAWDEVGALLRADGHEVIPVTLPGLESAESDRSAITLADHIDAICDVVNSTGRPVILAVHSGASVPGYGASDRIPEQIARMVYVDTAPGTGAINPDFAESEWALPSPEELAASENLDGLSEEQLATFRSRAIPQPGSALRDAPELNNPARLDVPSVVICTGFPSEKVRAAADEGYSWVGGLLELHDITYVDLPTSHWPMWSKPRELSDIISQVANNAG